jgi:uncharacterized RDD family membrane protein YckC
MKASIPRLTSILLPLLACAILQPVQAQAVQAQAVQAQAPAQWSDAQPDNVRTLRHPAGMRHHHGHDQEDSDDNSQSDDSQSGRDDVVTVGSDAHLAAGKSADSVVAIFGSAISEGEADTVVSLLGSTRVTGPVGDTAVSVLGNNYIDSHVAGDAVAVFGNLELGPRAEIDGDVTVVVGTITRDPGAVVHGETQSVLNSHFAGFDWLRPWIQHCLLYGRPLALVPGVGWAWTLALSFLALYVLLALLLREPLEHCVRTFESRPGHSIIAALLTVLLAPILIILLCLTVIGIAAVPFIAAGLFFAGLFGKAVILAWIGRRCTGARAGAPADANAIHPALAVLIGGAIVLVLYLVPVLGFIVYKLLGLLGLGVVAYALVQAARARRPAAAPASPVGPAATASAAAGPAASASPASSAASASPADPAVAVAGAASAAANAGPAAAAGPGAAAAPVVSPATLPRAGFWIRMAALLLDALLVGVLMGVLHHAFDFELLLLAIYGAIMWKLRGSTIGGIVFNLQVVRHDGREVDWATAIVRALG